MGSNAPHGTTKSYTIGFVLSLIFTCIPYYLVVEKVVSGNVLLATILGFAVLQMIIQIVFFLHLGREKSPHWQLLFFISTIGIILVVVMGSLWIMHHLHYNMTPVTLADVSKKLVEKEGIYQIGGEKTGACQGAHANLKVVIKNGQVAPAHTAARVCDTLTFINEDSVVREMTFGTHPRHGAYAGESELTVRKGRGKTITLTEPGTYQFHDHLHEETAGSFTVTP
ncbi:MAG TPA: cytochrome o ubiquinol oxidase subunit IV [Candidatus Saccharimonadales bacterium]|nr:cytochrome o ubiquinol oxidase subunit IV [Candidatus Saccharimonadales bacterium]